MITIDNLIPYDKADLPRIADNLQPEDIGQLVEWLGEKDDTIRYPSFLILLSRASKYPDVYPYWDTFVEKLNSDNSFHRSIGLAMMAENARWDDAGRMDAVFDRYLYHCDDEKPMAVRQCILGLAKIVPHKLNLCALTAEKLMSIDIMKRKDTQRKILLMDILHALILINGYKHEDKINTYITRAITGEILDKKAKKEIEKLL